MVDGITGWSAGGRRPLTYNLMPGQFRSSRVNIFPSQTIINNNIGNFGTYGYYDDCCCNGGGNKMGWAGWTMMFGMGLSFLGNMFTGLFGSGGTDGAGSKSAPLSSADLSALKNDAKAYSEQLNKKIAVLSDGTLLCDGEKYASFDELLDAKKTAESTLTAPTAPATQASPASPATQATTEATEAPEAPLKLADFNFDNNFKISGLEDEHTGPLNFSANATTTLSEERGKNIDAPKTITVNDGNKVYKFELVDSKEALFDKQPKYRCVSNGVTLAENQIQEYILSNKGTYFQNNTTKGFGVPLGKVVKE